MENPVMESEDSATGASTARARCRSTCRRGCRRGRPPHPDVRRRLQRPAGSRRQRHCRALRNADAIITPLATLTRTAPPARDADHPPTTNDNDAGPATDSDAPMPSASPLTQQQPSSGRRPSFDCAQARTRGEIAVCADSGPRRARREHGRRNIARSRRPSRRRSSALLLMQTRDRFSALSRPLPEPSVHRRRLCRPDARNPRHHGRPLAAAAISAWISERAASFSPRRTSHSSVGDSALRPASRLLLLHHARRGDGAQDDRRARGEARLPGGRARPTATVSTARCRSATPASPRACSRSSARCSAVARPPEIGGEAGDRLARAAGQGRARLRQSLQAGFRGAPRSPGRAGTACRVRRARGPERRPDRADGGRGGRAGAAARRRAAATKAEAYLDRLAGAVPRPALHRDCRGAAIRSRKPPKTR